MKTNQTPIIKQILSKDEEKFCIVSEDNLQWLLNVALDQLQADYSLFTDKTNPVAIEFANSIKRIEEAEQRLYEDDPQPGDTVIVDEDWQGVLLGFKEDTDGSQLAVVEDGNFDVFDVDMTGVKRL